MVVVKMKMKIVLIRLVLIATALQKTAVKNKKYVFPYRLLKILNKLVLFKDEEQDQEVGDKKSKGSTDGDTTTGSYSSLEDDEAEIDQLAALAAKYQIDNMNFENGNKICKLLENLFQLKVIELFFR